MALVAYQKRASSQTRRRSSVFPKLVFYKGSGEHDDTDESPYIGRLGMIKNRRLSVENNRRVVKHLRSRRGSIKERVTLRKEIAGGFNSEGSGINSVSQMFTKASSLCRRKVLFSDKRLNGVVHRSKIHRSEDFDNDNNLSISVPKLPTIIVEDSERTTSPDDSSSEDDSKRPTTPGIFVDWKSDSESEEDDVTAEYRVRTNRSLWSSKRTRRREANGLDSPTCKPYAFLWDVNCDITEHSKKAKVFISSDATMKRERQVLLTDVFPKLARLSAHLSMQFEMVDLALDNSPRRKVLAQQHIRDAAKESIGTSFLLLLSNNETYNQCTALPHVVPADIMQNLLRKPILEILACEAAMRKLDKNEKDLSDSDDREKDFARDTPVWVENEARVQLTKRLRSSQKSLKILKKYYELDENILPPLFKMKEENRNPTHDKYLINIFVRFIKLFHDDQAVEDWKNLNLQPDTVSDTFLAFQLTQDPRKDFLCFYRAVEKETTSEERLQFAQIRNKIGYNNTRIYHMYQDDMEKLRRGKDPKLKDSNSKYLEKFKSDAYNMISNQIRRKWEQYEEDNKPQSMHQEIAHHLLFLKKSKREFVGREDILKSIKKYISTDAGSATLALVGEKGCGLSSIMGMAASKVTEWRSSKPRFPQINGAKHSIVIYRSVGVTGESIFMKELLFGICCQLQDIANIVMATRCDEKDSDTQLPTLTMGGFQHIRHQLARLLTAITKRGVGLFLFIDNMSSIYPTKENNITNWLPNPLPNNVKVIISVSIVKTPVGDVGSQDNEAHRFATTLLTGCNIVNISKSHQPEGRNGLDKQLGNSNQTALLLSFFQKSRRKSTESQIRALLRYLNQSTSCLHIETLFHAAATWPSFTSENTFIKNLENWCPDTAVATLLSTLEHNHEKTFYRSVLCFLSLARNGLSQGEIIDLVARDNKCIVNQAAATTQSYSTTLPTTNKRTMRRLALKPALSAASERCVSVYEISAYWYKLIEDIGNLLMPCITDGTTTLKWQHGAYSDTIKSKYMAHPEELVYYHKIMSRYFSNIHEKCRCGKTHDCHQPLRWCGTSTSSSTINRRRLSESIFHAIRCNDLEHIKFEMLFNYEWLQAKLDTTSIEFLMDEIYNVLLMKTDDSDVRLLLEALFLSYNVLNSDPSQLPSQLIGRLNDIIENDVPLAPEDPRKYPHARVLLYHIRRSKAQYLMPTTTCLTSGTQIIYDPLYGHQDAITAIACCTDGQRIATASKDSTIKIWDIIERRVLRTIPGVGSNINSLCLCMGNYYVACSHENNHVNVWNIQKATRVMTIQGYGPNEEIHCTVAVEGQFLAIASKMTANIKVWDLDRLVFHKQISIRPEKWKCPDLSVARNSHATNILIGYKGCAEAIVVNVRRGKIIRNLSCEEGRITQVEVSREYYVIGCRERKMEVHELQIFFLFDSINYGLVRTLQACSEDNISHIFVNRLGSHLIGISRNTHGANEVVVWNMETDDHRHMVQSHTKMFAGVCTDLQYCMTAIENEWIVRIHNLASQITKHDHSRTQIRKKVDGIAKLYSMPKHDKYVVAQGTGGSPITIWNVARRRCKGKAVIIERGLLDKNDIVVVKDVMVVILSDRGMMSLKRQAFETIYVYNLLLRKYERKLHPVRVNICPPDHYHLLNDDKLLATSIDRTYMTIWSVVTGEVLQEIHPSFPKYDLKPSPKRQIRRRRTHKTKTPQIVIPKIKTNWKTCRVSPQEQLKSIYEMILSSDDSTLVCSYYARHMIVFDLNAGTHKHTLSDKNSILHLNKAVLNSNGTFLLCTNYDNVTHTSYLTLWDLTKGVVARRKQDEPKVCSVAMTDDGSRIVFVTEDNLIKIWDPFRRQSHRSIAAYSKLDLDSQHDDCQPTTIYLTKGGKRVILFANSISVWDLDSESLMMVFEPDNKFVCCTVAMYGQVVVVGRRDSPSITTLRLPEEDSIKSIQDRNRFGEEEESDDDSSLPSGSEDD